jgi:outer membrane lipoprotein-sorting protein
MKKKIITLFCLAVFALGSAYSQDLQEILSNYFKSAGLEKLSKIKSIVSTGKSVQMGMEMPYKIVQKRPNKAYLEVDVQGAKMIMAYNGEIGWAIQPWTGSTEPVDLIGPELRSVLELSDLDGGLWNYKEKGHQLELVGTEELEGTNVYVLKLTTKDGDIQQYYIDSESNLASKMTYNVVINDQETEIAMYMSNYQEVEGIVVPFATEQRFNGQSGMTINVEAVKYNEDIDDALFEKPAPAPAEKQ